MAIAGTFCANCGATRASDARFCASCGKPYGAAEKAPAKGWPVVVWLPLMLIVGVVLIVLIAGVPTGH